MVMEEEAVSAAFETFCLPDVRVDKKKMPFDTNPAMEAAEDDALHRAAGEAALPLGGALTVSRREWEQIEDIPPHTRAVGMLFQAAAAELRGMAGLQKKLAFSAPAFADVSSEAAAPMKNGTKTKAADIKRKHHEATMAKDRERAAAGAKSTLPPRREAFGSRFESFFFAALLWLRSLPELPRAVAAKKFLRWLDAGVENCPESALAELRAMTVGTDALAALNEICDGEEVLACDVCAEELSLRAEQAQMVSAVRGACLAGSPLLLKYKTPPSGGKSSASALLGAALADARDTYIIYACYSRPVRVDVCKHLVATCVPFAIVVQGLASPSFTCYVGKPKKPHAPAPPDLASRAAYSLRLCRACDRRPAVLVCDLTSTLLLLADRRQDILVFDEPTADMVDGMRHEVREILRRAPCITVLMSATVPEFQAMPGFVSAFKARHVGAALLSIDNDRLAASVTATSADGRVLAPHDVGASLADVRGSGHLRRFYSPRVLKALRPEPGELSFQDLLDYAGIREACLRILERRAAPLAAPALRPALDLALCCTSQARFLPGATLVVMDRPRAFEAAVDANLEGVASLRRLLRETGAKKAASEARKGKRDGRMAQEEAQRGWEDADQQLLALRYVVNARQHVMRFAATLEGFPERLQRAALLIPEDVLTSSNERVLEAALCGILFCNNRQSDAAFEAVAQTLAEKAAESFFVGDKSLVYGLNLPFDRLIVACGRLSRLELQQLCGRVGRTCRASSAAEVVFLDLEVASLAMTLGPPDSSCSRLFDVSSAPEM